MVLFLMHYITKDFIFFELIEMKSLSAGVRHKIGIHSGKELPKKQPPLNKLITRQIMIKSFLTAKWKFR